MGRRSVVVAVVVLAAAALLAASAPAPSVLERNASAPGPWPGLVDEENFRTLLIANSANDSQALRDVFVESLNTTLADLAASLNNRSVSDTSMERAVSKFSRENEDAEALERIREDRIHAIKYQILGFLGFTGGMPNLNSSDKEQIDVMREMYSQIRDMPVWPPSELYTEKVQSFYPSCNRPKNTDDEMWSDPDLMHLYFDLKYPEPIDGLMTDVVTAKLRLHKIAKAISPCDDDDCNMVSPVPLPTTDDVLTSPNYNAVDDIIRVSVYYYTRSLKKNKVKRKILDSRMLSSLDEEWTEFNVGAAAKSWLESGKNHGLVVQVEDQYGQLMSAQKYFSPMDCTNEASADARPIPGFLVASTNNIMQRNRHSFAEHKKLPDISGAGQNNALYFNSFMFPMIDLCTAEIPKQDIADQALKHVAEDIARSSFSPPVYASLQTSPEDADEIAELNDDTLDSSGNDTEHQPDNCHRGHRHLSQSAAQVHSTRDSWKPEKPHHAPHRRGNLHNHTDLVMMADGTYMLNKTEDLSEQNDSHENDNETKNVVFKEVAVSDDYIQGSSNALVD